MDPVGQADCLGVRTRRIRGRLPRLPSPRPPRPPVAADTDKPHLTLPCSFLFCPDPDPAPARLHFLRSPPSAPAVEIDVSDFAEAWHFNGYRETLVAARDNYHGTRLLDGKELASELALGVLHACND